jgi:unsaturated chondroitin disaccharide hydrolase
VPSDTPPPALTYTRPVVIPSAKAGSRFAIPDPAAVSFDERSRHVEEIVHSSTLVLRQAVRALIISPVSDRPALLVHRVAELQSRLAVGQFPEGADRSDRLFIRSHLWTSGFWPGALWQAASLARGAGARMLSSWALRATIAHFGDEHENTHDVGFMYGQSSLAAWVALCRHRRAAVCARLRGSVLAAANELRSLAAGNRRAGTVPTRAGSPIADTIIDGMMNVLILPWASRLSGNRAYAELALRHARVVARLLVRRDGSTAQAVYFNRRTGRVLRIGTHQGLSGSSTWARGQGWAVYGFSALALELRDRGLLRVALRTAQYVARHLPRSGVPIWDYNAPAGAPADVSAAAITAAGMFHLAAACTALSGVCTDPEQWTALGRLMLSGSLTHASAPPPLGLLSGQILNEHAGTSRWYNGGELIFGVSYALEATSLAASS